MGPTPLPRHLFPVTERWAYFNHAGVAPIPTPTAEAVWRWADEVMRAGGVPTTAHEEHVEVVRGSAARLMGVPETDVAFVKNTSEGLGFVANGLEWSPGDRVVVPDREFPSALYPWLALADRGVALTAVEPRGETWALPVDAFADAIAAGPPPRLVVTSWVHFGRGWRVDLRALADVCHAAGALLCVDAIQGLGVLPASLDEWGVDFATADGHKWLLSPPGAGVLYVRGSVQDSLRPLEPGWNSVPHREEWDNLAFVLDATARRFEGGTLNAPGIHGLGASVDLLLSAGVDSIWHHVDALCDRIADGVRDLGAEVLSDRAEGRSGIVSFRFPGVRNRLLYEEMEARGVALTARSRALRASPHGYNDDADVARLLDTLGDLLRRRGSGGHAAG